MQANTSTREHTVPRLTIVGPNLPRELSDRGTFHVHATGCAHLDTRVLRDAYREAGFTSDASSLTELCDEVYGDELDREGGEYAGEFHVAPCAARLLAPAARAASRGTAARAASALEHDAQTPATAGDPCRCEPSTEPVVPTPRHCYGCTHPDRCQRVHEGCPSSGSGRRARVDYYVSRGYILVDREGDLTYMGRYVNGVVNDRITVDGEGTMRPGWEGLSAPGSPAVAGDSGRMCTDCGCDLALLADPSSGVDHDDACMHWADQDHLRSVAADWQGGQGSCLYAFSSAGAVTIGISREVERTITIAPDLDHDDLRALLAFVSPVEDALLAASEEED